jgi:hypothetical protein
MHSGIVARLSGLRSTRCSKRGAGLTDAEELAPAWRFDLPPREDAFHVASVEGATDVLDPAMVLSADADLVAAVAEKLSCLVVGAGGETVSGCSGSPPPRARTSDARTSTSSRP